MMTKRMTITTILQIPLTMIKAMITMKIIIMMIMKTIDGKMYTVVVRLPFEMKLEPLMMMQLPLL